MSVFRHKRLMIIARGLPCARRTKFVDRFLPGDIFKPKYAKPPMVKNTGVTNRTAQARRQATIPQEDLLFLSVLTACQAKQTIVVIDADLPDIERIEEYQKIAKAFGYATKIITFKPESLPKKTISSKESNAGVHMFEARYVDFRQLAQILAIQKRLTTEKWVKVQLKPDFSVLESKGYVQQGQVPKRT